MSQEPADNRVLSASGNTVGEVQPTGSWQVTGPATARFCDVRRSRWRQEKLPRLRNRLRERTKIVSGATEAVAYWWLWPRGLSTIAIRQSDSVVTALWPSKVFSAVPSNPYANMRPTDDLFIRPGEVRFHQCQRSYELSWQRRWTDENTSPARFCLCGLLTFVKKQREASLQATLLFGYPLPKFPW